MKISDLYGQTSSRVENVIYSNASCIDFENTYFEDLYGKPASSIHSVKEAYAKFLYRLKEHIITEAHDSSDYGMKISVFSFDQKKFAFAIFYGENLSEYKLYITDNETLESLRVWLNDIFVNRIPPVEEISENENISHILGDIMKSPINENYTYLINRNTIELYTLPS